MIRFEALSMGDRFVVRLDGRIQQVGTPKELFNTPTNRFLAGFIGSPSMNFVRARAGPGGVVFEGTISGFYFRQRWLGAVRETRKTCNLVECGA
jgi:ABC-type sugar transport system ATPase subunit